MLIHQIVPRRIEAVLVQNRTKTRLFCSRYEHWGILPFVTCSQKYILFFSRYPAQTQNLLYCVFFTFKYYMFMVNIKHFPSSKDSSLSGRLSVEYTCTHMNNPPFSSTFDLSPAEQRTSSEVHLDTKVLSAPSKHKEAVNPPSLFIWGLVHSLKTKILSRQQGPGVDYQNRSCFHACFGFRMSVHVHEMGFFLSEDIIHIRISSKQMESSYNHNKSSMSQEKGIFSGSQSY